MNSRSCEITSSVPGYEFSQSCSQITASRSRWLVGSSSSSRSERHISARARFRRMRQPPEKLATGRRSEEHTSELQSLMRISYAVFCLKKKKKKHKIRYNNNINREQIQKLITNNRNTLKR